MRRLLLLAAGLASLASCQQIGRVLDPDVAQLERFEAARSEARFRDIANEAVVDGCAPDKPACGRLHAIRAEACLTLALAYRSSGATCPAPSAAARADLACAAEAYAAAMAATGTGFSPADTLVHRQGRAQALYCRAETEGVAAGTPFARQAASVAAGLPSPRREVIAGSAALFLASPDAGSDAARCAQARTAAAAARDGLAAGPTGQDLALLTRLASDSRARQASIAGCAP